MVTEHKINGNLFGALGMVGVASTQVTGRPLTSTGAVPAGDDARLGSFTRDVPASGALLLEHLAEGWWEFVIRTSFHGWPDNDRALRWMMLDCTADVTGFDNKSSGMADEFWLIGGSATEVNLNGLGLHGIIDQAACADVNVTNGATFEWYDPQVHTVPSIWDETPAA